MKKRLFAASMAFGLTIVLASCGGDNQTTSGEVKTTTDVDKTTTETKTSAYSNVVKFTAGFPVYVVKNSVVTKNSIKMTMKQRYS